MLDNTGTRQLAYVVKIDDIKPIPGRDRVECAVVGGWTCMVPKGAFQPNDLGIYFEIDSKLDTSKPEFAFLEKYHGAIKTQKFKNKDGSYFYSQGLLMSAEDLGLSNLKEGEFLTEKLGVIYASLEDNKRKANSVDKYKRMAQLYPNVFKNKFIRWIYRREWGKKFLFIFFGHKAKKTTWPQWVQKTDEERVQNIPYILADKQAWFATEKVDGTSTTFTLHRGKMPWDKNDYRVCSRNVCFDKPDKKCYYDTNVYLEMSEKYDVEKVLTDILNKNPTCEFITIQAETYGEGIQKRDYSLKGHDMAAFNLIYGFRNGEKMRLNPREMTNVLKYYNIPCVPIVDEHFILPDTVDELLAIATDSSAIDGGMREGLVFRSYDGVQSFKAVSNEFLTTFHK